MNSIDFRSNIADKPGYACLLVRKAYQVGNRVVLLADDERQLAAMDELLWTFSATGFLPHVPAGDALASVTPIVLTCDEGAELPHRDVLINMSRRIPAGFASFQRVIELVSADADDVTAGRQRFAAYKKQGLDIRHSTVGKA